MPGFAKVASEARAPLGTVPSVILQETDSVSCVGVDKDSIDDLQLDWFNKGFNNNDSVVYNVKGRLRANILFWENIGASKWVLEIIRNGYALPFVAQPQGAEFANHKSAIARNDVVTQELERLAKIGCIREVSRDDACIISPLGLVSNSGKDRLILDLRYVNSLLKSYRFKYEDLRTFRDIFEPGDWFFKFDYKAGYHHVDILPQHQQYLAFAWGEGQLKRYYVFTVLPFGLATATYVFTKIQKALVKHWRAQGIKIFTYLEDGIGGGPIKEISQAISRRVQSDVDSSGFLWHPEKSSWEPSQSGEVLGFLVDLEKGFFQVPDRRIKGLQERLKCISQGPHHTARDVAQITGTIVSMGLALGPVARLWTRGLYRAIMQASTWGEHIQLDEGARQEITFWRNNFELCHGQPIWLANPRPEILTYSDASNTGWGAKGSWLEEEKLKSSTWRELRATHLVLKSFLADIRGKDVRHRTDNRNVVSILQVGSRNKELHNEAVALYQLCHQFGVRLQTEWIPRELNDEADQLSRETDIDDYMLNPTYFAALDILWGPHTVDRFSSFRTRQIPRFCS